MMKMFLWYNVDNVTDRYHSSAGVVIIAETLEAARELYKERPNQEGTDHEGEYNNELFTAEPDLICECDHPKAEVMIFPDAGCC